MSDKVLKTRIKLRSATHDDFSTANPKALSGEFMYSTDKQDFKVEDGSKTWSNLPYYSSALLSLANGGNVTGFSEFKNAIETVQTLEINDSGTYTIDPSLGNIIYITLGASGTTLNITTTGLEATTQARTVTLLFLSNGYSIEWGNMFAFSDGTAPEFEDALDIVSGIIFDGHCNAVHLGHF